MGWGWTATIWLAYILTEGEHRKVAVLSGIAGCGKTTLLRRIQDDLRRGNDIRVAKSLALSKDHVTIQTAVPQVRNLLSELL